MSAPAASPSSVPADGRTRTGHTADRAFGATEGSAGVATVNAPAPTAAAEPARCTPSRPFDGDPDAERVYASGGRYNHELWRHPRTAPDGTRYFHHRLVVNGGVPGVVIAPVTDTGDLVLTRQWRPAIGQWMWEFPRGFGEGEGSLREAARELVEETGLVALDLINAARIHPDSGGLNAPADIVIAHVHVPEESRHSLSAGPDEPDISAVRLFPAATVDRMVATAKIRDAYTLAALALVKAALAGVERGEGGLGAHGTRGSERGPDGASTDDVPVTQHAHHQSGDAQ